MPTVIHRYVEQSRNGDNPRVVCRVRSGWVVMGDVSILPGYVLLLPDPVVPHLNALASSERIQFLSDMAAIGDKVLELTAATRINYEMLGNLEPALHAHIIPRYDSEPSELKTKPIWFYDWSKAPKFSESAEREFMDRLRMSLKDMSL